MYDFGCSTGNIGKKLADTLALRKASFTPVDNSAAMSEQYDGPGNIVVVDMATMDLQPFDVAICFLSLMFVPVKDRRPFLNRLQESVETRRLYLHCGQDGSPRELHGDNQRSPDTARKKTSGRLLRGHRCQGAEPHGRATPIAIERDFTHRRSGVSMGGVRGVCHRDVKRLDTIGLTARHKVSNMMRHPPSLLMERRR